ncbi:hypothetical protein KEM54_002228 [Ascosphaera aggregata]|nr:hypothetical protein KEM54_002228 [Ascosphaera aggregata]
MAIIVPSAAVSSDVSGALAAQLKAREALIAREKDNRSEFRDRLSQTARHACEIVSKIRQEEQETIWRNVRTDDGEPESFPGMIFHLADPSMHGTKLWRIAQRMPKGALLHCHLGAAVDTARIFATAIDTPGMKFSAACPLISPKLLDTAQVSFRFYKSAPHVKQSIWDVDYVGGSWIDAKVAADSFPEGGRDGFIDWLVKRTCIVEKGCAQHHLGVDGIRRKFNDAFVILESVLYYEPIFRASLRKLFETLANDEVQWVELRDGFTAYRRQDSDEPEDDVNEMVRVIGEEAERFKKTEQGRDFWGARIIYSAMRDHSSEEPIEHMRFSIKAKKNYPNLVGGFDLVGQEDLGKPLVQLLPELLWFQEECKKENVEIPFFFHAGECLGDGDSADQNLYDAIMLDSRRIGHGFSLYKHPLLVDMVKEKRILIETCPLSNEVLRLSMTVMAQPLPALLSRGVATSLSNDDPALLGQNTSGMTHNFWSALQAWENLGLAGLGSLAENSVRWAIFQDQNDEEWRDDIEAGHKGCGLKAQKLQEWTLMWEDFCQWILDEFGGYYS